MKVLIDVLKTFKGLRRQLLISILTCGASALLNIMYAFSLADFIDKTIANEDSSLVSLLAAVGSLLIYLLLTYVSETMFGKMSNSASYILNQKNAEVIMHMQYKNIMAEGDIIDRVNRDSTDFIEAMTSFIKGTGVTIFRSVVVIGLLARISLELTTVAVLMPILYNLLIIWISERKQPIIDSERNKSSELMELVEDAIVNHTPIRAGHLIERINELHIDKLSQWDTIKKQISRFWALVGAGDSFLSLFHKISILLLGILLVNQEKISIGEVFSFLALSPTFLNIIWDIQPEAFRNAISAAKKILAFWDLPTEREDGEGFIEKGGSPSVLIENLSFSFNDEKRIIDNLSEQMESGSVIGIQGESGRGKSTLLDLISGFYDPEKGTVFVMGNSTSKSKLIDLRKHIAYMEQTTVLWPGSILENITFIKESDLSDEEIIRAEEALEDVGLLYLLVEHQDQSIETLSQGEMQRIGFARCIYKNAPIWLLDEPASFLDDESEIYVLKQLKKCRESGITAIVVSHKESILQNCDRIILL